MRYITTIELDVTDKRVLYEAAFSHATQNGLTREQALQLFREYDEMDIGACLVQLLDPGSLPGCEIEHSEAQSAALTF
jgi:hypothetical protein